MTRLAPLALVLVALLAPSLPAFAQDPTADEIVNALTPKEATRGLKVTATDPAEAPRIDMRVQFAYNSDELENEAVLTLRALGAALRDPRLKDYRFEIIGHTDAKGSAEYNQALSERRAQAVLEHLVFFHHIDRARLTAIGKGESEPINTDDPEAAENRRVEIINVGS